MRVEMKSIIIIFTIHDSHPSSVSDVFRCVLFNYLPELLFGYSLIRLRPIAGFIRNTNEGERGEGG